MDNIRNSRQRKQRRNLSLEDKINIIKRKETDVKYIRNIIRRLDESVARLNARLTSLTEFINQ